MAAFRSPTLRTGVPWNHLHKSRTSCTSVLQRRTFLPNPLSAFAGAAETPKQTLTASRTLAYPSQSIYRIIADVDSYSAFLPFCSRSTVTKWSDPVDGQKWPSEADLVVGWKGVEEKFKSRIFCIPGQVVEAVSGDTKTSLPSDQIKHHTNNSTQSTTVTGDGSNVLSHLLTRWTVRESSGGQAATDVDLAIEFQFANPLYSAMSGAVADRVAGYMIEAFESRVEEVLRKEKSSG